MLSASNPDPLAYHWHIHLGIANLFGIDYRLSNGEFSFSSNSLDHGSNFHEGQS